MDRSNEGKNKERPRPESFKKPVKLLVTGY